MSVLMYNGGNAVLLRKPWADPSNVYTVQLLTGAYNFKPEHTKYDEIASFKTGPTLPLTQRVLSYSDTAILLNAAPVNFGQVSAYYAVVSSGDQLVFCMRINNGLVFDFTISKRFALSAFIEVKYQFLGLCQPDTQEPDPDPDPTIDPEPEVPDPVDPVNPNPNPDPVNPTPNPDPVDPLPTNQAPIIARVSGDNIIQPNEQAVPVYGSNFANVHLVHLIGATKTYIQYLGSVQNAYLTFNMTPVPDGAYTLRLTTRQGLTGSIAVTIKTLVTNPQPEPEPDPVDPTPEPEPEPEPEVPEPPAYCTYTVATVKELFATLDKCKGGEVICIAVNFERGMTASGGQFGSGILLQDYHFPDFVTIDNSNGYFMNGKYSYVPYAYGQAAIVAFKCSKIIFKDFKVDGTWRSACIVFDQCKDVAALGNDTFTPKFYNLAVYDSSDVTLQKNKCDKSGQEGIMVRPEIQGSIMRNIFIYENEISNTGLTSFRYGEGIYLGNGADPKRGEMHNVRVMYNKLTNIGHEPIDIKATVVSYVVRFNEIDGAKLEFNGGITGDTDFREADLSPLTQKYLTVFDISDNIIRNISPRTGGFVSGIVVGGGTGVVARNKLFNQPGQKVVAIRGNQTFVNKRARVVYIFDNEIDGNFWQNIRPNYAGDVGGIAYPCRPVMSAPTGPVEPLPPAINNYDPFINLDAKVPDSILLNGNKVSLWYDDFNPLNYATQGTDANRPIYNAGGPYPNVQFQNKWLTSVGMTLGGKQFVMYAVVSSETASQLAGYFLGTGGATDGQSLFVGTHDADEYRAGYSGSYQRIAFTETQSKRFMIRFDQTATELFVTINKGIKTLIGAPVTGIQNLLLGVGYDTTLDRMHDNCKIYQVCAFAPMSEDHYQEIEAILTQVWGLT